VGITSAAAVSQVKRKLKVRKVGHLGTLDPFASGLLPICIGEATKLARFLAREGKAYSGVIKLGTATDSMDCTGRVVEQQPVTLLDTDMVAGVRRFFTGRLKQTPPMFSAVKKAGTPLYKLARQGLEVERSARDIFVKKLELAIAAEDALAIFVECSKGTYVRALADEIARALGSCGHLVSLRRTAFGQFEISQAVLLEAVGEPGQPLQILSPAEALAGHRRFFIDGRAVAMIRKGQQEVLSRLKPPRTGEEIACLLDEDGAVVAVVESSGRPGAWRVARVLAGGELVAGRHLYKQGATW